MKKSIVLVAAFIAAVGVGAEAKKTKTTAPAAVKVEAAKVKSTTTSTTTTTTNPTTGTSSSATSTTTETVAAAPFEGKILGEAEVRPTTSMVAPKDANRLKLTTENYVALGYQFTKDSKLRYYQPFNTNLYDPTPGTQGLGLVALDGFFRGQVQNIWKNDSGTSFNYEGRVYTPTAKASRDAGFITALRTYLKLNHDFNKTFSIQLSEIPIIPVFSRAGEGAKANWAFENRVYLIPTINFTEKLSLDLPFLFHQTRSRAFNGAAAKWSYVLWAYPELTYSVNDNNAFGIAYYSDNLVKSDLSGFAISDGLKAGATQVFYRATL